MASLLRYTRRRPARLALLFVASLLTAGASDTSARFESIGHKMVCTCGCGQILLECNHVGCPNSEGMIQELRQKLAAGDGDTSIFNSFAAKYGPIVLAAPIRGGFDNAAWAVPVLVSVLAMGGTVLLIRRWRMRTALASDMPAAAYSEALRERIRRDTEF